MPKELKQPEWCGYSKDELGDATTPLWGLVENEECCKNCELYKDIL